MAARPTQLDLYLGTDQMGSLYDTEPPQFAYVDAWLARPQPTAVQAFFENLLPEGELRDYLLGA